MQSILAHHISRQSELAESIRNDISDSNINVQKAAVQLRSAKRYFGGPRYWVVWFMFTASGILLFLDYYYS
jgi:hypothetical protein